MQLQTFMHDLVLRLAAPPLCHRGRGRIKLARFQPCDPVIDETAQQFGLGLAFRQLEPCVLEIHDPAAERLAVLHVFHGFGDGKVDEA